MKEKDRIRENAKVLFNEGLLAIATIENTINGGRRKVYFVNPELSTDEAGNCYSIAYYLLTTDEFRKNNHSELVFIDLIDSEINKIDAEG